MHLKSKKFFSLPEWVLLIQLALILYHSLSVMLGYDLFWHLRLGLDYIEKGLWPDVDRYSIHRQGDAYTYPMPIVFEYLGAYFYKMWGLRSAVSIIVGTTLSICMVSIYAYGKCRKWSPYSLSILLIMVSSALLYRSFPRPEVLSYPFLIVELLLVFSFFDRSRKDYRYLIYLAIVQWLWVNVHASSIFGFVILGGLYIELIVGKIRENNEKEAIKFAFWGLLTLGTGFLHEGFQHPMMSIFNFSSADWEIYIAEYNPLRKYFEFHYLGYFLAGLSLVLFVTYKRWMFLIVVLVFFQQTTTSPRIFSYLVLVVSMMSIYTLESSHFQFKKKLSGLVIGLLVIFQWAHIESYIKPVFWKKDIRKGLPIEISEYLINNKKPPGNILNIYEHGGYFLFSLPEGFKVLIDGRTGVLYSLEEMHQSSSSKFTPNVLYDIIHKSKINYAVGFLTRPDRLLDIGIRTKLLNIEYLGQYFALLETAENNKYNQSEILIAYPACIDQINLEYLQKEYQTALSSHGPNDTLPRLQKMAINYLMAKDKNDFFNQFKLIGEVNIYDMRMLAIMSLNQGRWNEALQLFDSVVLSKASLSMRDRLLMVKILIEHALQEKRDYILKTLVDLSHKQKFMSDKTFLDLYRAVEKVKDEFKEEFDFETARPSMYERYQHLEKLNRTPMGDFVFKESCENQSELNKANQNSEKENL